MRRRFVVLLIMTCLGIRGGRLYFTDWRWRNSQRAKSCSRVSAWPWQFSLQSPFAQYVQIHRLGFFWPGLILTWNRKYIVLFFLPKNLPKVEIQWSRNFKGQKITGQSSPDWLKITSARTSKPNNADLSRFWTAVKNSCPVIPRRHCIIGPNRSEEIHKIYILYPFRISV